MMISKFLKRFLMAGMLLVLLLTAGCGPAYTVTDDTREAVIDQGNAYLQSLKQGDLKATMLLMDHDSQKELQKAIKETRGIVNIELIIRDAMTHIARWNFDHASVKKEIFTNKVFLTGTVEYKNGKTGVVQLGFKQDLPKDETWRVCSSNFHD